MSRADRHKLHFGPYRTPPLKRGDRAHCHFRDCPVIVTGWSDARIPWPRCRGGETTGPSSALEAEPFPKTADFGRASGGTNLNLKPTGDAHENSFPTGSRCLGAGPAH